jgi:hypothetical protein
MTAQSKVEAATLHGAMALAFAAIEKATKSATNPHFKSKYANLEAVIDTIKPPLVANGLFFTQHCHPSDHGVSVETMLHHASGESMSLGTLYVPANKQDPQGFGSALTYARRYGLQTGFGVPTEDDDGNAAVRSAAPSSSAPTNPFRANQANDRDAPFPPGPCKNKTELKAKGRDLWADVMACDDQSALEILLISQQPLVDQLKLGLPQWWNGGNRDGEPYEGLGQVIERLQRDFAGIAASGVDMRGRTVFDAG